MDIQHKLDAVAALTLGKDMCWRDYVQGAYRMRGIGRGQRICLYVIPEVVELISRDLHLAGIEEKLRGPSKEPWTKSEKGRDGQDGRRKSGPKAVEKVGERSSGSGDRPQGKRMSLAKGFQKLVTIARKEPQQFKKDMERLEQEIAPALRSPKRTPAWTYKSDHCQPQRAWLTMGGPSSSGARRHPETPKPLN
ncbi:unnamed protein product [Symbiodinium microadriaticum]|nr:unnamed protein product [Symbiodinium microadriaticum]CAE7753483.1 unnamed protein product [Symbiodinium sp. KB8]